MKENDLQEQIKMCVEPFARPKSVVQDWLSEYCTWKQQTVLLAAFRGCDGLPKNDPSKAFTKLMRSTILNNADVHSNFCGKKVLLNTDSSKLISDFFTGCLDAYPVHWLMHFLQAAEIVAYKSPYPEMSTYWKYFYLTGVNALHLNPETEYQLDERLADNDT